ncbi:MAG TPA: SO2930 family diheme c-type cytochrome [Saprospiraceae bacterium]|nr:SO2930 family diheme c-type cytochrome [Saprospiraceae bacterium]HMP24879.1 SO2930 family diheme c-type cytochrome [Saprospiraceae bacterium]
MALQKNRLLGYVFIMVWGTLLWQQCRSGEPLLPVSDVNFRPEALPYRNLSEYGFFVGTAASLRPNERVLPYDLITPLFSDYAWKARYVWMPDSVQATVSAQGDILFPDHTVLIKTFYYPKDFRRPNTHRQLMETRLLIKQNDEWQAYTYIWDEAQREATLSVIGDFRPASWTDEQGNRHQIEYVVPNKNQCKSCHNVHNAIQPIGPKVRNLDRSFAYADGATNQLVKWRQTGILDKSAQTDDFQALTPWDDPNSGTLHARALAYLDVNCGHCHRPEGPAHTTGLYLTADQTDKGKLGFCKTPVAAGRGSGGRKFGIVPGQPDASILLYRMESDEPSVMMPEFGRVVPHREGIELIRNWIANMEGDCL